jgi:hypothetical protein
MGRLAARLTMTCSKSFADVLSKVESVIGHPDVRAFMCEVGTAKTDAELQRVVGQAVGSSEPIEFIRFDFSAILRTRRSVRLVVGNPLIMKQMIERVADAGSYAPVTILIDERPDGVHVSCDRMATYLEPWDNAEASKVARDLDSRIESLLTSACR